MKMKNIISAASACLLAAIICLSGCSKSEQQQSSRTEQQESKPASSQASEKKESSSASSEQSSQSSTESSSESSSGNMEYINTITPTIWEVTDKDNNRMFMMGTIHLGDKSVEHMPDYFETAFSQCDALAVECDSSSVKEDLNSVMQYMYTDGTTIKDHVDEEDYYKAVKILKDTGAYIYTYDYVKPFLWISATEVYAGEQAGLNADYGVDNMLQKRALSNNMEIIEVEGADFQNNVISSMSDDLQAFLFHEMANTDNYLDELTKELTQSYDDWKSGNENFAEQSESEESLTEEEQKYVDEYNKLMLTDRNKGMADKAEEYIKSGKTVFFAVGGAHFTGDNGIKKLLENRGYTFRKLTTNDAVPIDMDIQKKNSVPADSTVSSVPDPVDPSVLRAA